MTLRRSALALLLLAACDGASDPDAPVIPGWTDGTDGPTVQGDPGDTVTPPPSEPALVPLEADLCDEPAYSGATWQTETTAHFNLNYIPGTQAETDKLTIATRLEQAYADIRNKLGITATPVFTVNLSPSRNAAYANNKGYGRVWPWLNRYDVVYTGTPDSFEVVEYGQLLTYMLDYQVDPANRYRAPILQVGLAQYLDQSNRDLQLAYAQRLAAGVEARVHIADFDKFDVNGNNPGRAGSFVQFLVNRYGWDTFLQIYKATAVYWQNGCNTSALYGPICTPDQLTSLLDGVIFAMTSEHWADIQPLWQGEVEAAMAAMPLGMARAEGEIDNLVRTMDEAIRTNSAALYRTTMEGFYCDWGGDTMRDEIAARTVWAYNATHTQILGVYETGMANFTTANVFVMRTDDNSIPAFQTLQLEHVPAGWRVAYSPDWY